MPGLEVTRLPFFKVSGFQMTEGVLGSSFNMRDMTRTEYVTVPCNHHFQGRTVIFGVS